MLRAIRGVARRGRIGNLDIRRELKVEPLLDEIERIYLRWYGYGMRMTDTDVSKHFPLGERAF